MGLALFPQSWGSEKDPPWHHHAQPSLWLSSFYRTKILYSLPSLSHVVYGEFEYQRNSLGDEKDLNESGITPNKVI